MSLWRAPGLQESSVKNWAETIPNSEINGLEACFYHVADIAGKSNYRAIGDRDHLSIAFAITYLLSQKIK